MAKREAIAAKLRGKRAEAGLSQEEVAMAIGSSNSALSRVELAQGALRMEDAWALADLYGCSLDELVGRIAPTKEA